MDSQGFLKNAAGLSLQGWLADTAGNINTDPSNIALLQPINVSTVGGAAGATTAAAVNANLQASQTLSQASIDSAGAAYAAPGTIPANADPGAAAVATAIMGGGAVPTDAYDPTSATTSMTAYDATTGTGTKPDFSVTIPLADSQGGARSMQIDFLKSDTAPNQWNAEAHVVPASDVSSGAPLISGQVSTGIVSFTPDGRLDPANTTLFNMAANGGQASITFGPSNGAAPAAGQVNWAPNLGINGQTVALTLGSAAGGMTQYDSQSIVQSVSTNGTPFGNLTAINIDSSGFVTAAFDNGVTRRIAQVAIARTFPNPDGLSPVSERRLPCVAAERHLQPEGAGQRRGRHHLALVAGSFDRGPLFGVQQPDHDAAGLLRFVQDHYHCRPNDAGPNQRHPLTINGRQAVTTKLSRLNLVNKEGKDYG